MFRRGCVSTCAFVLFAEACSRAPTRGQEQRSEVIQPPEPKVVSADGNGQETKPRVGPNPGQPVETAPPNVPEFKPAFAGQTRAPAVHSQTQFKVDDVATELAEPWAIAFLPDRR